MSQVMVAVKEGEAYLNGQVVRVEDVLRKAGVDAEAFLGKQLSWIVRNERIVGLAVAAMLFIGGAVVGYVLHTH